MVTFLLSLGAVSFMLNPMLKWFEHQQVFAPLREMVAHARDLQHPFEEVSLTTEDGIKLHGWFFSAHEQTAQRPLTILLLHGNAGNISTRLDYYQAFLEIGLNVLTVDYRGYGLSQGSPSEEGTYHDAEAAYRWLRDKGFPPRKILVMGESLGGGIASELVMRQPAAGLILFNSFTSIPNLASELMPWLPVRWLGSIQYDTLAKLPRINTPVLILHSPEDRLIGIHHGQRNFDSANEPKMFWKIEGGHSEALQANRSRFNQGLTQFLDLIQSSGL